VGSTIFGIGLDLKLFGFFFNETIVGSTIFGTGLDLTIQKPK